VPNAYVAPSKTFFNQLAMLWRECNGAAAEIFTDMTYVFYIPFLALN
jgi:hypothetical protein